MDTNDGVIESSVAETTAPVTTTESAVDSTPETTSQESVPESKPEKMVSKSYANSMAARAAERARAEAEARYAQMREQSAQTQTTSAFDGVDPDAAKILKDMVREEAQGLLAQERERQQQELHQREGIKIAEEFSDRVNDAAMEDPEFAELYGSLNLVGQPDLVRVLHANEETAGVVKELAKNPRKYAEVLTLINSGAKQVADRYVKEIAQSIKANKVAATQKNAPEPLTHVKPSRTISTLSDGPKSVSDFRKNPRFRG